MSALMSESVASTNIQMTSVDSVATLNVDFAIMGAGLAGLTAATRAAELGLKVALLDQGSDDKYPCNSRFSGGILHLSFQNVQDPPAALQDAMRAATCGYADNALTTVLAQESRRAVQWLQQQGARFVRNGQINWQQWVMAPPRPISPGLDWNGRGPDVTLRVLLERFRKHGGTVLLQTRVEDLWVQEGRCVGLKARCQGQPLEIRASSALIADGGFQSNLELLRAHIAPEPTGILQRGAGVSKGDGMQLAASRLGAAVSDLTAFYGHLLSRDAFKNPLLWPYPQLDELACAGMVVNIQGERVADEGMGGVYLANQVAHRQDPLDCFVLFDQAIWDEQGTQSRIPANPHLLRAGATMLKADSIEALAAQMGVPAAALAGTVASFNDAVASGRCDELSPPRSTSKHRAVALQAGPFYALPMCVGITHTAGGLRIDSSARVVREDGSPIEGLYAAGSAVGAIEGGPKAGYIGGLMKALVFGLVAAESVAKTTERTIV